jgi:hypothetical protein
MSAPKKEQYTLEEAKELLDGCLREGLVDYAFGDSEIGWWLDGCHVAEGYFSGSGDSVTIESNGQRFVGAEARELKHVGRNHGRVLRNDSLGN